MPRAVLLLLDSLADLHLHLFGDPLHCGCDLVALVADHGNKVLGVHAGGGVERVGQQAAAANLVQRLLAVGLHAGSCTGREHDNGTFGVVRHSKAPWKLRICRPQA